MTFDDAPLCLTGSKYFDTFEVFKKYSDNRARTLDWFRSSFVGTSNFPTEISVLSVGSGNGAFDLELIRVLQTVFSIRKYVCVEPNEQALALFRERARSVDLEEISFEFQSGRFDRFETSNTFHFTHFIHSLMYIEDKEEAISRALRLTDGTVVIVTQTFEGVFNVRRQFLLEARGEESQAMAHTDVQAMLDRMGVGYKLQLIPSTLDVTAILKSNSDDGCKLLSFILLAELSAVRHNVLQDVVREIEQMTLEKDGRFLCPDPIAVFVIDSKHEKT